MKIYSYSIDKNGFKEKVHECYERRSLYTAAVSMNNGAIFRLKNEGKVLHSNKVFFTESKPQEAAKLLLEAREHIIEELNEKIQRENKMKKELEEVLKGNSV